MRCKTTLAGLVLSLVLLTACGPKTPAQKLTGKSVGSIDASEGMDRLLAERGGKEFKPTFELSESDQMKIKVSARLFTAMPIELRSDGTAVFTGQTHILGLGGDKLVRKGTWEIVSSDDKDWVVKMGTADHQAEGELVWRDDKNFFFRFETPGPSIPSGDDKPPEMITMTLLFKRGSYE